MVVRRAEKEKRQQRAAERQCQLLADTTVDRPDDSDEIRHLKGIFSFSSFIFKLNR